MDSFGETDWTAAQIGQEFRAVFPMIDFESDVQLCQLSDAIALAVPEESLRREGIVTNTTAVQSYSVERPFNK